MDVIAPCFEKVEALTESLTHGSIFFFILFFFFGPVFFVVVVFVLVLHSIT